MAFLSRERERLWEEEATELRRALSSAEMERGENILRLYILMFTDDFIVYY